MNSDAVHDHLLQLDNFVSSIELSLGMDPIAQEKLQNFQNTSTDKKDELNEDELFAQLQQLEGFEQTGTQEVIPTEAKESVREEVTDFKTEADHQINEDRTRASNPESKLKNVDSAKNASEEHTKKDVNASAVSADHPRSPGLEAAAVDESHNIENKENLADRKHNASNEETIDQGNQLKMSELRPKPATLTRRKGLNVAQMKPKSVIEPSKESPKKDVREETADLHQDTIPKPPENSRDTISKNEVPDLQQEKVAGGQNGVSKGENAKASRASGLGHASSASKHPSAAVGKAAKPSGGKRGGNAEAKKEGKLTASSKATPGSNDKRPRALSAYVLFCNEFRESIEGDSASMVEMSKMLSEMWKNADPEERKPFEEEAAAQKESVKAAQSAWDAANGSSEAPKGSKKLKPTNENKGEKRKPDTAKNASNKKMRVTTSPEEHTHSEHEDIDGQDEDHEPCEGGEPNKKVKSTAQGAGCGKRANTGNESNGSKGGSTSKVLSAKPKSGFQLFTAERRPEIKVENPGANVLEVSQLLDLEWKNLTEEERSAWSDEAKERSQASSRAPSRKGGAGARNSSAGDTCEDVGLDAGTMEVDGDEQADPAKNSKAKTAAPRRRKTGHSSKSKRRASRRKDEEAAGQHEEGKEEKMEEEEEEEEITKEPECIICHDHRGKYWVKLRDDSNFYDFVFVNINKVKQLRAKEDGGDDGFNGWGKKLLALSDQYERYRREFEADAQECLDGQGGLNFDLMRPGSNMDLCALLGTLQTKDVGGLLSLKPPRKTGAVRTLDDAIIHVPALMLSLVTQRIVNIWRIRAEEAEKRLSALTAGA